MAQVNYNQPTPSSGGGGGGDGHGGIYAILIIVVLLILAAVLYFGGVFGGLEQGTEEVDIDINQPSEVIEVPDVNIDAPDIQLPDTITVID